MKASTCNRKKINGFHFVRAYESIISINVLSVQRILLKVSDCCVMQMEQLVSYSSGKTRLNFDEMMMSD